MKFKVSVESKDGTPQCWQCCSEAELPTLLTRIGEQPQCLLPGDKLVVEACKP